MAQSNSPPGKSQVKTIFINIVDRAVAEEKAQLSEREVQKLDFLEKEVINMTSFQGRLMNEYATYLYFLNKYPNSCYPSRSHKSNLSQLSWTCKFDAESKCYRYLSIPDRFAENFIKCMADPTNRFIYGIITLYYPTNESSLPASHANSFLYDKNSNSIELFEPRGTSDPREEKWYDQELFLMKIKQYFNDEFGVDTIYHDFCPKISLQRLERREKAGLETDPSGFCLAWSLWWLNFRLANADSSLTRSDLINAAIKTIQKHPGALAKFIRNYAEFIVRTRNELTHQIFEDFERSEQGRKIIDEITETNLQINILSNRLADLKLKRKDPSIANLVNKDIASIQDQLRDLSVRDAENEEILSNELGKAIDLLQSKRLG